MPVKMILITDNPAHILKGKAIAKKNRYEFQSYSPKKWEMMEELESQVDEDREITSKIIPLPTGHTPLSSLKKMESDAIEKVLISCNGNASKASRILKVGRATLYRKMERLGLDINGYRTLEESQEKQEKPLRKVG
ncbi:MAG: hypothetical protein OXB86_04380 [Bdellovibrionales bacterium]|nr:hypothetical protein [Bdellovibrionales bacterium]